MFDSIATQSCMYMYHYVMLHVDLELLLVFITIFYSKFMIICNHPKAVSTVVLLHTFTSEQKT